MASRAVLLGALLLVALPLPAAELEGVKLDDSVLANGEPLELNGLGLRRRFIFDVYVVGLYLPKKARSAPQAISMPGAKRVRLVMKRSVGADLFAKSLLEGLERNTSEEERARLQPQVQALVALMQKIGEAKEGSAIDLDYAPNAGLVVRVDGAAHGAPIAGEDFYRALLRIWLGEHPVSQSLKQALLGERS